MTAKNDQWAQTNSKNLKHLAFWTFAWVLSMALVAFGPKLLWDFNATISVLLIVLNTAIGVGMILANRQYLKGLDEMERQINLDAMALALGVGVVGGLSYSALDIANVMSYNAEISHLVILIGVTYLIAILVGYIRYK